MTAIAPSRIGLRTKLSALVLAPAVLIFVSSNLVNVGNLAFNMIFSRLMGPELFGVLALLLTIKLAILGVLGALQMSVSQVVAATPTTEILGVKHALARINRSLFVGLSLLLVAPPLAFALVLSETIDARFGALSPHVLLLLLVSMPFGAAFSVLRGLAFGQMMTARIVISANVEMGVRLIGALLAWALGFGLEGVVAAISLSIVAGWAVLADLFPRVSHRTAARTTAKTVAITAAPFGALQLAQVVALDGDIFVANAALSATEAGYIAVLSLFQRIQFFACFALAGVLLPGIVIAARNNTSLMKAAAPVFGLFAFVGVLMLAGAIVAPERLVALLVGADYVTAASGLIYAVTAAILFTLSYLGATFLVALNNRSGVWIVCLVAAAQITTMILGDVASYIDLLHIKVWFQAAAVALLVVCLLSHLKTRNK